jgi:hypothetical protein
VSDRLKKWQEQLQTEDDTHVHEDDTHPRNSMKARTLPAPALLPAGNQQGAYLFFILKSKKVVRRRSWTSLPMPEDVINQLNELMKTESKRVDKQLTITFGGHELPDEGEWEIVADAHQQVEITPVTISSSGHVSKMFPCQPCQSRRWTLQCP